MISVVIPVKNGGQDFVRCLQGIRAQLISQEIEIVVVDSGSTDGSIGAARQRGAVVQEIPTVQFTHGGARNIGAGLAKGDLLVFISQDAVPVGTEWLERLVGPLLMEDGIAGVYGRQLPHLDATPPERYFLGFLYGARSRRQRLSHPEQLSMDSTLFSNVNSAIPRNLWERYPFVEDIVMSEDQEWSRRVLLDGYIIAYEPEAAVRHSHNYTLGAAFRRFFDSGVSAERAYLAGARHSSKVLRNSAFRYALGELTWLREVGEGKWIPYAALYEGAKMLGLVLGANHERIPLALKRRMSAIPSYWG
jgi:rhamnosyltransferase